MDLDELALGHQAARHLALGAEGRDEGDEHDEAGIGHQAGDVGDTADVLDAVSVGEAEIAVEAVADVVAVEDEGVAAQLVEAFLQRVGDGGFAGAGEAGEPEDAGRLRLLLGEGLAGHINRLPVDVGGAAEREVDQAERDRVIGLTVDQDEAAGQAVDHIGIKWDRLVKREGGDANLVEFQRAGRGFGHRVDVDAVLGRVDGGRDGLGAGLQEIAPAREERAFDHPEQLDLELVGDFRRLGGGGDNVAARGVDLVGEGQRDGLARDGLAQVACLCDDSGYGGFAARGERADPVARLDAAGGDLAGEAAEIEVRAVDPLDRHPQREGFGLAGDFDGFEIVDQAGAGIPGRLGRALCHVGAGEGGDRDRRDLEISGQGLREDFVVGDDLVVHGLTIADEVHLVDGEDEVADAEQGGDDRVAARLGEDALAGVDHQDGAVGGRGAGRHVARVLFVAGRVGDDELAFPGREEAVGDVDGDALLALGGEAVDEEGEVDGLALRAVAPGVGFEGRELVFEDHLRIVEEAPDQGGLAVIDRAAGDEAEQGFLLVRLEIGADVFGDEIVVQAHQK